MKKAFGIWLVMIISLIKLQAQEKMITGFVSDAADSSALPGVTVAVKGKPIGTVTDLEGKFSLKIPEGVDTLVFSFIGYQTIAIAIGKQSSFSISLDPAVKQLDEVMVTAFGISREKKSLGYAASTVNTESITKVRSVNVSNAIKGKSAGVQVTKTTGGPAASTRIIIRGNSLINGNNQALIVVDGIPVDNSTFGSGGEWGGIDYGSGISDINPDDIESMTILKGPNAAALYGSRATNGVILITTRKGQKRSGIGITFNSNFSVETADIQRKFQNTYGAGQNGQFEVNEEGLPYFNTGLFGDSWGPRMEGQQYLDWDSVVRPYSPQPDNYKDYFQTGHTLTNSIALEGGSEKTAFRLSLTDLDNRGITPNATVNRTSLSFRGNISVTPKLSADLKVAYTHQHALNRLNLSDGRGAGRHYTLMPRNITDASLRDYKDPGGQEKIWYTSWAWMSNPYWMVYENKNEDWRDRLNGHISLSYPIKPWLSVQVRSGQDGYQEKRERIEHATGSFANREGNFEQVWVNVKERNSDFLLHASHPLTKKWTISGNIGGNRMYQVKEIHSAKVDHLSIPHFYHINFSTDDPTVSSWQEEKRINSFYGAAQISYNNYLFVDLTGRNDWSSTLPPDGNAYFYPSVNASLAFTEALNLRSKVFSFGKLRASWAEVGNDAPPYLLSATYASNPSFNGLPRAYIHTTIPFAHLKPERTRSMEVGTDLYFFNRRIAADITLYRAITRDQILATDIPVSSGFQQAVINSGKMENKGIEIGLQLVPVRSKHFSWQTGINFSTNKSKVISLAEGLENIQLAQQWSVTIEARPGNAYGDIVGTSIAKDEQGNRLVGADGLYIMGKRQVLGNVNPDWLSGITNTLSYKNWTVSFLIDIKKGGDIFSATNVYGMGYSGAFVETLPGREEWYASETAREAAGVDPEDWTATGGYVAEGVYAEGTVINGQDVSGQTNSTFVDPKLYWSQFSNTGQEIPEQHVYDASFVKWRELYLGYRFSGEKIRETGIEALELGLTGRNLWLIHKNVPNIDPEAAYNNGNGQGLEYGTYPVARSIGLNLKVVL